MSFVHREANWGAQTGTSALQKGIKPRRQGVAGPHDLVPRRPPGTVGMVETQEQFLSGSDFYVDAVDDSHAIDSVVEIDAAHAVTFVAVTNDQELRASLARMLPRGSVVFADSPEQVLSNPAPNHCGVLIVECAINRSAFERLKSHLKASAPALVNIMVGAYNDGGSLIRLLSAGCIDRFMVKPLRSGPARNALQSALQQHYSLRSIVRADQAGKQAACSDKLGDGSKESPVDKANVPPKVVEIALPPIAHESSAAVTQLPLDNPEQIADRVVAQLRESRVVDARTDAAVPSRQVPTSAWGFAFAALIAVLGMVVWGVSMHLPEPRVTLDVNKVIAGHLAAAQRAFELGSYVDPPELSATHFYAAALELDPGNMQARRGLDAVADRLIADGKQLIVAGDLLRAQSALDNVRRMQPNHRELAEVTASLLKARETERLTIRNAQAAKPNLETVAVVAAPSVPPTPPTLGKPSALERPESLSASRAPKTTPVAKVADSLPSSLNAHLTQAQPHQAQLSQTQLGQDALGLTTMRAEQGKSLESVQKNVEAPIVPQTAAASAIAAEKASPLSAAPANMAPISISTAPRGPVTSGEVSLIKYVPPVYPYKARAESAGGWLDVSFSVTSDGSVIDPRIEKGTLGPKFHRAALAAVTQWKFSPATNGSKSNRPITVRMEFRLTK